MKIALVSLHGDFGTQGMKGCLCYGVVFGTEPRRKSLRVIERAATNSHSCPFPTFIRAAYFLDMLKNYDKRLLAFSCLSVCPSVCPYGRIRLPLDRFSRNLTFKYLSKLLRENSSFIKSDNNKGYCT